MSRKILAVSLMLVAAACNRGERQDTGAADSLSRDLRLAPADSTNALNDRPGAADTAARAAGTAAAPTTAAPGGTETRSNTAGRTTTRTSERTTTRRTNTSAPTSTTDRSTSSASSSTASGRMLAAGTEFSATTDATVSSAKNKVGDEITATVTRDVKDANGRVVIPTGSKVTLRVTAIHESENKSDTTGTLTLDVASISVNGHDTPVKAHPTGVHATLQGRKTNAGDVAKVGAGAGIGAVAGRVLGGSTKGAIIGGIIGGAVGAQRAVETKDRDVVVPSGSTVTIVLDDSYRPTT